MNLIGNITPSRKDDRLLDAAVEEATNRFIETVVNVKNSNFPETWDIVLGSPILPFSEIIKRGVQHGESLERLEERFGGKIAQSKIISDARIVYLRKVFRDKEDETKKYEELFPLFIGEIKKQGTNDKRLEEGKSKQAQGNAAAERVLKNWAIFKQYCYYCDNTLFPYVVFLHGYDFGKDEITTTTLSKLKPFFGELNHLNVNFKSDCDGQKYGGSCFYRGGDYQFEELVDIIFKCLVKSYEIHLHNEEWKMIFANSQLVFSFSD